MTIDCVETPYLLVALPQLTDRNFQKTVLLVVDHNAQGALAFVLNRPSLKSLKDYLPDSEHAFPAGIPSWHGGPVGTTSGLVLHNQPGDEARSIIDGMYLSSSEGALRGLLAYSKAYDAEATAERTLFGHQRLAGYPDLYPFRFLVGYAGWGPRQLDDEIRLGAWMQLPLNRALVFNTTWHSLWGAAMESVGVNPLEIAPISQQYLN